MARIKLESSWNVPKNGSVPVWKAGNDDARHEAGRWLVQDSL